MARVIDRDEVRRLLAADDAVLIEVMPDEEFRRRHIAGAVNIPLERIGATCRARYRPDRQLILYCADQACAASDLAARKLALFGFRRVLEYGAGKQDWQDAGLPMASGP